MKTFWNDKERLHRLAGIMENESDDTLEINSQMNRQKKVIQLITETFNQLQLPLANDNSVVYYEDENYEAIVTLDVVGDGISIANLYELYSTGLSDNFNIDFAKAHSIQVHFIVDESKRDIT